MLLWLLLKGVGVGIIIAVPVGPVGIFCVRRTIVEGKLAGFLAGLGAATADAIFGVIAAFGLSFVSDWLLGYQYWLKTIGGLFLIYVGIKAFRAKAEFKKRSERNPENLLAGFASTFFLTITNPITILAFLAIFTGVGFSGSQATIGRAAILVLGVWLGSLLWWLLLSLGAGMFRHSLGERHLGTINRSAGILMVLSGLGLLGTLFIRNPA